MPRSLAVVPDLEAEIDRLYGLPLEEFTTARNDLAKRLRRAGQREAADAVAKLSKPPVVVWAANQLARRRSAETEALVTAGERLRDAQKVALAGGGGDELRAATAAERAAVRALVRHLSDVVGPRAATLGERVTALLHATAADDAARRLLQQGRLQEELEASGFGLVPDVPRRPVSQHERAAPAREDRREAVERARAAVQAAKADVREARAAAVTARKEAERAQREAEKAAAVADEADERVRAAEAELAAADASLAAARG
jgi:hypothetical protein